MQITTIIPTSSIPTHPSTEIVDETIKSVRERLVGEIIICFDGVRPEQAERKEDYEEYIRRMLIKYKDDPQITPLYFKEHTHQVGMMREALKLVDTPFVQFVEQDTPLVGEIDYALVLEALKELNLVRFSHESIVLDVHKHMFFEPEEINGCPVVRTIQYSARPHVARTDFYRWVLCEYFPKETKEFIEDRLYGIILSHGLLSGKNRFKMAIYAPKDTYLRSLHNDGRRRSDGTRERKYDGVGGGLDGV